MKTLGYIVTDRKLKNIDGFVEQVTDIQFADSTKPILIVGWKMQNKTRNMHPYWKNNWMIICFGLSASLRAEQTLRKIWKISIILYIIIY